MAHSYQLRSCGAPTATIQQCWLHPEVTTRYRWCAACKRHLCDLCYFNRDLRRERCLACTAMPDSLLAPLTTLNER